MKKVLGVLLIAMAIVACNNLPKDATIISGKIENAKKMKELKIIGKNNFSQIIKLKEDGTFLDTLQPVKSGMYTIKFGRGGLPVYLESGDNFKVNIDLKNRENPISFLEGKAIVVNNYISKKNKVAQDNLKKIGGMKGLFSMKEDKFLETVDKLRAEEIKELENTPNLPTEFVDLEKRAGKYDYISMLSNYPRYYVYLSKDQSYKPSEKITNPIKEVKYDIAKDYEDIATYRNLVMEHFQEKYYDDKAKTIEEVKALNMPAFNNDFAGFLVQSLSLGETDMAARTAEIKALTQDEKILKSLDEFLKIAATLGQGNPSPKFAFKSIKGKEVKLEQLKGKLVYIDVWATWCGPCKGELPFLQKLEKEYHRKNIAFVSISVDKDKAAWENMVKAKKLGGIQLHADNAWQAGFVKAYQINAIPRFILLDKQGNIISADAPRPSSNEIKPLMNEWLKK